MWPFGYFKKKREKEEQMRRREEENAHLQKLEQERIVRERERRLEENRKKEEQRKVEIENRNSFYPFTFKSDCHQRYESNIPVQGLQQCGRTVSVISNTNGCPGYRLEAGVGYIVKIYNDNLGKPNMSDKPMKLIRKTNEMAEFRGFPIEAQTPFGWQEIDYSDYGLTIYYKNSNVCKCVLHMYDRGVDLEYRKESASTNSPASASQEKSIAEKYVEEAFTQIKMGKDGDSVYHPLYKAWRAMQADPACIKKIHNKREAGNGLLVFLSYGTIRDIDDRQQIISLSYLMLSEEIEINPNSLNTIKNRILSMTIDREAFQYTVSAAIGTNAAFDFMGFSQFESRDAALKMLYKDLTLSPVFKNLPDFAEMLNDLEMKISNDFFGGHETPDSIKAQGETNHSKVLSYLREKVYEEECLDF